MKDEASLIDTNIIVHGYVLLRAGKHRIARNIIEEIWKKGNGITALQNLCEFFSVVTKQVENPMPLELARKIIEQILTSPKWQIIDRDEKAVLKAMDLVEKSRVPFWDALIAASMLENGIKNIFTENEKDFKRVPGIRVINPFKEI